MRIITIMFSVIFLFACSHVSVRVDPATGIWTANYWRLGNQEMNGLEISKTGGDITLGLDSQKATDKTLQEILRLVRQMSVGGVLP